MDKISRDLLQRCSGFDWDEGNIEKNWRRHTECEQIFFNRPLVVRDDIRHSATEQRFYALGKTDMGRFLFIAFTVRKNRIRVISARNLSRKERRLFRDE